MKLFYSLIGICIGLPLVATTQWPYGYLMRIHCKADGTERPLHCVANGGMQIISPDGHHRRSLDVMNLNFSARDTNIVLNMSPLLQNSLWVDSPDHSVQMCGTERCGTLYISADSSGVTLYAIGNPKHLRYRIAQKVCNTQWGIHESFSRWSTIAQNFLQATHHVIQGRGHVRKKKKITVRVLLDESTAKCCNTLWHLFSAGGFFIDDPSEKSQKRFVVEKSELCITHKKNCFYVNGRRLSASIFYVKAVNGHITKDNYTYQGDFIFIRDKQRLLCINCLDLESYTCSVLQSESWPGWPIEVNKAFAIMARSYAMAQASAADKKKRLYHIKNTNVHQTYRGVHSSEVVKNAVQETEGIILTHNDEPILAMFDSCCGGVIPMNIESGIDFTKAPYLARSYSCPYCKGCKIYQWHAEYDLGVFERHVCSELHAFASLHDVAVTRRDKAGLVMEIALRGHKIIEKISGRQLYSLLHGVKSYCFDITSKGKKIIIKGHGFGHHLGLCQWGAREMVRLGHSYQRILFFYYPKTSLMRLS
jgi:stage II sporulation protein D